MADFNFFLNSQGARGRKGEQGEQGFSPIITVYEQTATSYRLQIETLDGTFVTPNLLPAIQDAGGTVLQFDREQQQYFLGALPSATDETEGLVRMASEEDLNIVSETGAVTPIGVFTVAGKTIEAGTDNVHVDVDNENTKIIISVDKSSEYVLPVATTTTLGGIKPDNQTIVTDPVTGETHANFDEIGNALNALSNKVNKIDEDVLALDGLLIDTQGDVEVLQDDVRGINVALNEIDGDIQGLDTRVTNLENKELPDNVFTADNLKNGTNVTFRKVGDETFIDAVGGGEPIDAYTKQETDDLLAARDTRITNVESEVTGIQTDVSDLDEMVSDLTITVNNVSQEVTDVKGTVEGHTESITTIEGNITDINNNKQNKLIAGENINIDPETNTISATGGEGKEYKAGIGMELNNDTFDISRTVPQYVENFTRAYGPAITPEGAMTISWGRGVRLSMPAALDMSKQWTLDFDYTPAGGGGNVFSFLDSSDGEFAQFYPSISSNTMTACWFAMNKDGTYGGNGTIPTANYVALGTQYVHIEYTGHSMIFKVGSIKGTNNIVDYELTEYQQYFEPFYGDRPLKDLKTIFIGYYMRNPRVDTSNYGTVPLRNFKFTHDGNVYTPYIQTGNAILASDTELGLVQVDGTTITANERGVISAIGGGADPDNVTIELNEEGKLQTTVDINALQNRVEDVETNKQDTLISGTNIKTINGESLLGEGDIEIKGGGGGSASVINAVIKGSPTINGTQVSGFSNSNYLQLPFILDMEGKNLDASFFFVTGDDVTTQQNVVDSKFGLAMAIKDGHGLIALGSTGTSWDIGVEEGTLPIQPNTAYYGRLTHDGTAYRTELSTDGKVFNPDIEIQSTAALFPTPIYVGGYNESATHAFEGIIDMAKCNVKLNDMEYWNGIINDYESLSNLPTIAQYPLKGDLGLAAPLRIERTSTDALYNAIYNSNKVITFSKVSASLTYNTNDVSGSSIKKDGTLGLYSFMKIPYKLGDVVYHGHGNSNTSSGAYQNALLGYTTEEGGFRPVISLSKDYNSSGMQGRLLAEVFSNYSYHRYKVGSRTSTTFTADASYSSTTTNPELSYANISQLIYNKDTGIYELYAKHCYNSSYYKYTFNAEYNDLLQKIDTVCFYCTNGTPATGVAYSQCWVKQYSNDNNVFNSITYPQLKALPDIEIPKVNEHNRLTCGDINNSYALLEDKPKLGGVTIEGNLNPDGLNLQRTLSPTNGLEIKQTGEWNLINASYNETTKQITFNNYDYGGTNSSSGVGYFNPGLSSSNSIGTYVDNVKLIPKAGIIIPFYTNVTWIFDYISQRYSNRLIFGEYDGTHFTPKFIHRPVWGTSMNKAGIYGKVTGISPSSTTVFTCVSADYGTWIEKFVSSSYNPNGLSYLTIMFDGVNYTFTTGYRVSNSTGYKWTLSSNDALKDLLNSCNSVWYIPNVQTMGLGATTKIVQGDVGDQAFNGMVGQDSFEDITILPDTEGNILHTSIGVKTDNDTIQLNTQGQLSVPALGGMKLVKLTDEEYAALETKDVNTLYVVTSTDAVHIYLGEIQIT